MHKTIDDSELRARATEQAHKEQVEVPAWAQPTTAKNAMVGKTAHMRAMGPDGEWTDMRGTDLDEPFVVGDPTFSMPRMTISIKAGSESIERILAATPTGRFPINLTVRARPPKRRRHARGGLRPMVAARIPAGRGARRKARRLARANPRTIVNVCDRKGACHYSVQVWHLRHA